MRSYVPLIGVPGLAPLALKLSSSNFRALPRHHLPHGKDSSAPGVTQAEGVQRDKSNCKIQAHCRTKRDFPRSSFVLCGEIFPVTLASGWLGGSDLVEFERW